MDNILEEALKYIVTQEITYIAYVSSTINAAGYETHEYANPIVYDASVQPVQQKTMYEMGLDFDRLYFEVWLLREVFTVGRDRSGDVILFEGRRYNVVSVIDWNSHEWNHFIMVDIGEA